MSAGVLFVVVAPLSCITGLPALHTLSLLTTHQQQGTLCSRVIIIPTQNCYVDDCVCLTAEFTCTGIIYVNLQQNYIINKELL